MFNYARAMLPGVLLSCVYFIPTLYELRLGKAEDGIDWYLLKDFLRGNPLELVRNYYIGSGRVWSGMLNDVFCGMTALLGVIGLFCVPKRVMAFKDKLIYACLLIFMVCMYYLSPFYFLFSLLKQSANHTGRYLYLGCFILVYMAGCSLLTSVR